MSSANRKWLSLTEASELLGVHQTTLRRWTDSGNIPCFRTPGGHRRFDPARLSAWMERQQTKVLSLQREPRVQEMVGVTRHEMIKKEVSGEAWYVAFEGEFEQKRMREAGRRLLGLAIHYMGRIGNQEPALQEGQRIGTFFGRECAQYEVSLVDTMRAFFFFRESLLRSTRPGLATRGQYDAEEVRMHRQLRLFLDAVMYACLAGYEAVGRLLLRPGITA